MRISVFSYLGDGGGRSPVDAYVELLRQSVLRPFLASVLRSAAVNERRIPTWLSTVTAASDIHAPSLEADPSSVEPACATRQPALYR